MTDDNRADCEGKKLRCLTAEMLVVLGKSKVKKWIEEHAKLEAMMAKADAEDAEDDEGEDPIDDDDADADE